MMEWWAKKTKVSKQTIMMTVKGKEEGKGIKEGSRCRFFRMIKMDEGGDGGANDGKVGKDKQKEDYGDTKDERRGKRL